MNCQLEKLFDTSDLISEIRKLAFEVDECTLPNLKNNEIVSDLQTYRRGEILDRYNLYDSNDDEFYDDNYEVFLRCYKDIEKWREHAVKDKLHETLLTEVKEHRKKKSRRDIEADIRKQREKYHQQNSSSDGKQAIQKKMRKLWRAMVKKEMGKSARQRMSIRRDKLVSFKRAARECARLCRQRAVASGKCTREALNRGRRLAREVAAACGRRNGSERSTERNAAASAARRQLGEQKRRNLELLEARRQQRKLNYLITQTELYTHFMSRKMGDGDSRDNSTATDMILSRLDVYSGEEGLDFDKESAVQLVRQAVELQNKQISSYSGEKLSSTNCSNFSGKLFKGELKSYQEKGRLWLLHLFEQGINGILADEMGLGKTVQTVAFLATLAEKYDLWGPFLVVAPASTVHNWAQELARFVPSFRVVPYWGSVAERRILRRYWTSNTSGSSSGVLGRDSAYHVVVTSYQVLLQDSRLIGGRVRWQYLVLDEAHAIKNTASQRWNTLLGFECRNRLLLTGTPIQNTMQELWALLHFIMPTLFDSHEEFNDWFSRDIESHAAAVAGNSGSSTANQQLATTRLTAAQLSRLHMILQPFMLRRVKVEVEHELPRKEERLVRCHLSTRQEGMYERLKRRIKLDDLNIAGSNSVSGGIERQQRTLLNLLMQLRKVCNHPDLVEPRQERLSVTTPFLPRYITWPRLCLSKCTNGEVLYNEYCLYPLYLSRINKDTNYYCQCHSRPLLQLKLTNNLDFMSNFRISNKMPRVILYVLLPLPPAVVATPIQLAVHMARVPSLPASLCANGNSLSNTIQLVSSETRIADSAKLATLDVLLARLHREGHRVLVYSQMTRMIDIIEDLLRLRRLSFIRLDGSSRLCDRRDMVAEFQQTGNSESGSNGNGEIFIFLLSTRAGGLGINLTAADTVIFFDSDWNPTVDEQAMDRAHRLGQQRPVTVYRLVCEGTVERQILARAEEKRQMQRMVIAGGGGASNLTAVTELEQQHHSVIRARDVASLLLEDREVCARLEERRKTNRNSSTNGGSAQGPDTHLGIESVGASSIGISSIRKRRGVSLGSGQGSQTLPSRNKRARQSSQAGTSNKQQKRLNDGQD